MKFLRKRSGDLEAYLELTYENRSQRDQARELLVHLQYGFCAYSERYLKPLDSVEVEHFDPRKKNSDGDSIANWHAVLRWMNAHKARKIEPFLPLPELAELEVDRFTYERGEFICAEGDIEAINLLEFLGVNRPEVFEERAKHVKRVRRMRELCKTEEEFRTFLIDVSPDDLSFPTALEAELGIPAFEWILEANAAS
ncbi:hypothetical protein [Luteolibacter sp. Populi]|uniref:hypothetical protein n=1 Tax=Luteolibacter sp. Populi TaxID=3230487 RepID=UPI003465396B